MKFRLHSTEPPGIRQWDEGSVVFSPRACETCFLDPIASEGLLCLSVDWMDEAAFCDVLAARLGVENDDILRTYAGKLIVRFDDYGLLEMVPP